MNEQQKATARACLAGAEDNSMSFPEIVDALMAAGFESYAVDFRRATAIYYLPGGGNLELPAERIDAPIAPAFDPAQMQAAIREAQQQVPGYSYHDFCLKAVKAGCAGYLVSFPGRRALYVGRSADIHVEHFPQ